MLQSEVGGGRSRPLHWEAGMGGPYALMNPCSWWEEEAPTFMEALSYAVTPFSACHGWKETSSLSQKRGLSIELLISAPRTGCPGTREERPLGWPWGTLRLLVRRASGSVPKKASRRKVILRLVSVWVPGLCGSRWPGPRWRPGHPCVPALPPPPPQSSLSGWQVLAILGHSAKGMAGASRTGRLPVCVSVLWSCSPAVWGEAVSADMHG